MRSIRSVVVLLGLIKTRIESIVMLKVALRSVVARLAKHVPIFGTKAFRTMIRMLIIEGIIVEIGVHFHVIWLVSVIVIHHFVAAIPVAIAARRVVKFSKRTYYLR